MKKLHLLALTLALTAACSGSADSTALTKSGFSKLGTNDFAGAQADLHGAIDAMPEKSGAAYHEAKMGLLEAMAHTDSARARTEFDAYVAAAGATVTTDDIARFGSTLMGAGDPMAAVEVVHAGLVAHPDDPKLINVKDMLIAKSKNNSELAGSLAGLGYL